MSRGVELVLGLEVHVRLDTGGKLFCGCRLPTDTTKLRPNTAICDTCLGHPGTMPELRPAAVRYALALAQALGAHTDDLVVPSRFERKHYFYWDLPKNYQVTQIDYPFCHRGRVRVEPEEGGESGGFEIDLTRIHLEEDAARKQEDPHEIRVDFNRSGSVLAEIVTEPDFRSPEQAAAFLRHLQRTLRWHNLGSALPEHGDFRCDVNLSVRFEGDPLPDWKVELKNLARLEGLIDATRSEKARLTQMLRARERGEEVEFVNETREWVPEERTTRRLRGKETASQYWYYVEPDLLTVEVSEEELEAARQMLRPPLSEAVAAFRRAGFGNEEIHRSILPDPDVAYPLFHAVSRGVELRPARALVEVIKGAVDEHRRRREEADHRRPEHWQAHAPAFADFWHRVRPNLELLVDALAQSTVGVQHLRELAGTDALVAREWSSAEELLEAHDLAAAAGGDELETAVRELLEQLLAEHPEQRDQWLGEEDPKRAQKLANFFQGRVMRQLPKGSDGRTVKEILNRYPSSAAR